MSSITPKEARDYLDRWALVNEAENAELRAAPLETKFQQLAVLMASRTLFPADADRETEARKIRERWALIRQTLSA